VVSGFEADACGVSCLACQRQFGVEENSILTLQYDNAVFTDAEIMPDQVFINNSSSAG